ncbi:MAG: hypothetical protein RBU29_13910, partial [bacterium]|nr:hypothetical protein [bacterium]
MKHLMLGLGILILGLVLWFVFSYVLISEEQRIYQIMHKGARSVEKGSLFSISQVISPQYSDASGLDRDGLLGVLRDFFSKSSNRKIIITDCQITLEGKAASADITFQFQSDIKGGIAPYADWIVETTANPVTYR